MMGQLDVLLFNAISKATSCGKCGWQRGLVCCNPKSQRHEWLVGRDQPGCDKFQRSAKK